MYMNTPFDLTQKVAIIAGGTGGLGRSLRSELEAREENEKDGSSEYCSRPFITN